MWAEEAREMKVIDTVNKTELDLTAEELVDLVANQIGNV